MTSHIAALLFVAGTVAGGAGRKEDQRPGACRGGESGESFVSDDVSG